MITMRAPRPHYEHYVRGARLYRADAEGQLQQVLTDGSLTYEIDGRDLADLSLGGCRETRFDREDLRPVNESRQRLGLPHETAPLVPATEEERIPPAEEVVQEPVSAPDADEAPVQISTRRRG